MISLWAPLPYAHLPAQLLIPSFRYIIKKPLSLRQFSLCKYILLPEGKGDDEAQLHFHAYWLAITLISESMFRMCFSSLAQTTISFVLLE